MSKTKTATCRTCGQEITIPDGWPVGPAVRKHYWEAHPERMEKRRADRAAERSLPSAQKGRKQDE